MSERERERERERELTTCVSIECLIISSSTILYYFSRKSEALASYFPENLKEVFIITDIFSLLEDLKRHFNSLNILVISLLFDKDQMPLM